MQLLTRTPTRHYFISIFVIVSVLFITFSTVIYRQYSEAQRLNEWTLQNYEIVRQYRRILLYLLDMETGVRGYMLSGKKKFLEPYEKARKGLGNQLKELTAYTKEDAIDRSAIDGWLKKIEALDALLSNEIRILDTQGISGLTQGDLDIQKQRMDDLRASLEGYIEDIGVKLKQQNSTSKDKQKNFKHVLTIGTVLAVGSILLSTLVILSLIERNRRAEEAAREVENRFLSIMRGIDDGLYDFNLVDGTIYYSPSYKTMLGYTEEELPNTVEMFNSILHPDDYERTWDTLRKYQEGKTEAYNNMFRLRHKDRSWVWVLSRGVGLKDKQGKMIRLIGTHTDITEQKNREEELRRISKEMETFTYITSHDLRAPLVNLKGFAGELQLSIARMKSLFENPRRRLSEEERQTLKHALETDIPESLRFIVQSVEKMDALTTAVLDLSRIGRREYHFETVDTRAIVKRCLDTLGYEISQKDIEIACNNLPPVVSDPLALEQIFSNILDNAVKYLEPERKGKIDISATEDDSHIIFRIKDNGRGIAEADKEKVFQIFRRARNTANIRGRGMGMTFVQATLRKLGGAIWFDSSQGKGSTFYLSFPKHPKMRRPPV